MSRTFRENRIFRAEGKDGRKYGRISRVQDERNVSQTADSLAFRAPAARARRTGRAGASAGMGKR